MGDLHSCATACCAATSAASAARRSSRAPSRAAATWSRLIERHGLESASLVGVSMGGRVALEVAVARPELVDRARARGLGPARTRVVAGDGRCRCRREEAAFARGDFDAVAVEVSRADLGSRSGRRPEVVDPSVREQVAEMERRSCELQFPVEGLVEEEPLVADLAERLGEIKRPDARRGR